VKQLVHNMVNGALIACAAARIDPGDMAPPCAFNMRLLAIP
jgi:hypothetical protein